MIRNAACLMIAAALSALAGAQAPKPGLTTAQQHELFQRNRVMIQTLVDTSVEISTMSGDYLQRSKSYRKVIMQLHKELSNAAESGDVGRVTELGNHLDTVMRQGLSPSLRDAVRQIGPAGTGRQDLLEIRDRSAEDVDWLLRQARSKWSATPAIRQMTERLEQRKKELGTSMEP